MASLRRAAPTAFTIFIGFALYSIAISSDAPDRHKLADWLSDPDGIAMKHADAVLVADSMPEDVARQVLDSPDPKYVHLWSRCVPVLIHPGDTILARSDCILCAFCSLAHTYVAAVRQAPDQSTIVWDTVISAIYQPGFKVARLAGSRDSAETVILSGVPSGGIHRFAIVEWGEHRGGVVAEFSGMRLDTADIDHDRVLELKVTDRNYAGDTTIERYFKRDSVTAIFHEMDMGGGKAKME